MNMFSLVVRESLLLIWIRICSKGNMLKSTPLSHYALILLLLIATESFQTLLAVGAYPFPRKVEQPDGSVLTIQLHGDEWFNWISTSDGYRIKRNDEGVFEYMSLLKSGTRGLSGVKANDVEFRTDKEKDFLRSISRGSGHSSEEIKSIRGKYVGQSLKSVGSANVFAPSGTQKMLVILANFSNTSATYSQKNFDDLMNLADYNGTGSFRDYYLENSNGALVINSLVTQWVTLPHEKAYYSDESKWGEFAMHAVDAAAAAGVDFSEFDNDGNGIVEGIAIIHQGAGQEVTGNEDDIWSHSWLLSSAGYSSTRRRFNGVLVDRYTAQAETRNAPGSINTIGVIAHEFGHNLGLPDYYDTNSDDDVEYSGTGRWDLMASGSYNGFPSGVLPSHHNPLSKHELGWITIEELTSAGEKQIRPVQEAYTAYMIPSPVEHEYFLLENRRNRGFDISLPGEGMIVYHVDEQRISESREANTINATEHQGFYVVAATGDVNASSAPFPGSMEITMLSDDSDPAMVTWTGEAFNRSISGIRESGDMIIFDYMALQNGSPLWVKVEVAGSDALNISWEPPSAAYPVMLAYSESGIFGIPVDGYTYSPGETIAGGGTVLYFGDEASFFAHSGLLNSSTYYYSVWSWKDGGWTSAMLGNETTEALPVTSFPWNEGFEDGMADWRQSFSIGSYMWRTATAGDYGRPSAAYEGESLAYFHAPDYNQRITDLVSPPLSLSEPGGYIMDFRNFQAEWSGDRDIIQVLAKPLASEDWVELAAYDDNTPLWLQRRVFIPFSENVQIAFRGISNYGYGIGIDDITVYAAPSGNEGLSNVSSVVLDAATKTSLGISWQVPEGTKVMVVAKKDKMISSLPELGTPYLASSEYGAGDSLTDGSFVVYAGSASSLELTGLQHSSDYHFALFSYNDDYFYQTEALRAVFATTRVYHPFKVLVSSEGQPLEGAAVTLNESSISSDQSGIAELSVAHDTIFNAVSVSANNYEWQWFRFKPDSEQLIEVELEAPTLAAPRNISFSKNNKDVALSWDAVIDETFDAYQPFALSMPGWSMIDNDGEVTYAISDLYFPNENYRGAFIVIDPWYEGLLQADFDFSPRRGRQLLAAFAASSGSNDDWLITPAITISDGDYFNIVARSLSDTYGLEKIRVLLADQSASTIEYELLSDGDLEVPIEWNLYSYDLSRWAGKRVKLALQYVSEQSFALLIDYISVGAKPLDIPMLAPLKSAAFKSPGLKRSSEIKGYAAKVASPSLLSRSGDIISGGRIGYSVWLNGAEAAYLDGFDTTTANVTVSECLDNEVQIETVDILSGSASELSEALLFDACNRLSFVVRDLRGDLGIEGALVSLNGAGLLTDANGELSFRGVEQGLIADYEISAHGYTPRRGSVIVDDDILLDIELEAVDDFATSVRDKDISTSPVPVGDELTVSGIYGKIDLAIFDISGRLQKTVKIEAYNSFTLPLGDLQSGFYIVRFKVGGKTFARKILRT